MHEMSLAESVVQLVEEAARNEGCSRIRTIWLEIGALASVEPEALRFCFEAAARDSCAAGAQLEISILPGEGRCMQCSGIAGINSLYELCPACGGALAWVSGGNGMRVKELEIE